MAEVGNTAEPETVLGAEPWAVVVKNTFIEVLGEDRDATSLGRPSSLPPSVRLCTTSRSRASRRPASGRRCRAAKATREEDASTEAESSKGEEDASTEAGTSMEEEQSVDAEGLIEYEQPGVPSTAATSAAAPGKAGDVLKQAFGSSSSTAARRLNSAAQAWKPSAALSAAPSEAGRRFHLQLERIIQAATSILLGCPSVVSAEATRATCGWTISTNIRREDFHYKEFIFSKAKEAFLMAAEASENVYVLGYLARPFVASLVGFSARFAAVQDDHQACWGLLKSGFCHLGSSCRWRHPESQATVSVLAMLASESP
mmetsp:Transcript_90999/g.284659  ORF Transcript_90999/g.284659 Transcript_90999/m.284659 type:complete len:315 (-) Transcript_90999:75-1019(-)